MIGLSPSPGDVAVIHSILPTLADQLEIDWNRPLKSWSRDEMTNFLLAAWLLANAAEGVLSDKSGARILKKTDTCEHGMPQFLCRLCKRNGKDDRPDDGIPF
jgi:hypothetical protein